MKKFILTSNKIFLLALFATFATSFSFLSYVMREIPISVVYAIWAGIGTGGGVMIGILFVKESKSASKFMFIAMIILSSVGLKILA